MRYYPWSSRTEADTQDFVQRIVDQQSQQPRCAFQLVIALRENERLIGNCGLRRKAENDWEAVIGYALAPDYWGQGYATEAAAAMQKTPLRRGP